MYQGASHVRVGFIQFLQDGLHALRIRPLGFGIRGFGRGDFRCSGSRQGLGLFSSFRRDLLGLAFLSAHRIALISHPTQQLATEI